MDLTAIADELYAAQPDEFVARRADLAAQAKAEDKTLAAEVRKLAKPTVAAWVVNMLVRHETDQVDQVLDLGAALREAQQSMAGEELRQLGRQRRQLTAAVTRQARSLAARLGQKVSEQVADQVEETLHAAMVDDLAAQAVRLGQLVRPLALSGTEVDGVVEAVAVPDALGESAVRRALPVAGEEREVDEPSRRPALSVVEDDTSRVAEAEVASEKADRELAAAERGLAKARRRLEKREAKGLQLQSELEELRRRIAEVEQRVEDNEDDLSKAEEARDTWEDRVEEARSSAERARRTLETLR